MSPVTAPVIVSFPSSDHAFAAHVHHLLAGEPATAATLEDRLRGMYPLARVVPRDRLAGFNDNEVWYAYRDGRVSSATGEAWWMEPGVAWHEIGADGIWADLNDAMATLVELPRDELVGRTWEHFGTSVAIASQGPIWDLIEREGIIDSLFRLRRADGWTLDIEYHMERVAPGRYHCWWRRVHIDDRP